MTNRRDFLKGIATVGAASGLGVTSSAAKTEASTQAESKTREKSSAAPLTSREEAMEWKPPDGYSETEAE